MVKELNNSGVPWTDPIKEDFHIVVYKDRYPVSQGHLLFVPTHDTPELVQQAFYDAYKYGLTAVENGKMDGFNIGMNYGIAAGQTVMYPHIHLIPRRFGDVEDPTGGVRSVIPGKANYKKIENE